MKTTILSLCAAAVLFVGCGGESMPAECLRPGESAFVLICPGHPELATCQGPGPVAPQLSDCQISVDTTKADFHGTPVVIGAHEATCVAACPPPAPAPATLP